jgi:hypothetical protein
VLVDLRYEKAGAQESNQEAVWLAEGRDVKRLGEEKLEGQRRHCPVLNGVVLQAWQQNRRVVFSRALAVVGYLNQARDVLVYVSHIHHLKIG